MLSCRNKIASTVVGFRAVLLCSIVRPTVLNTHSLLMLLLLLSARMQRTDLASLLLLVLGTPIHWLSTISVGPCLHPWYTSVKCTWPLHLPLARYHRLGSTTRQSQGLSWAWLLVVWSQYCSLHRQLLQHLPSCASDISTGDIILSLLNLSQRKRVTLCVMVTWIYCRVGGKGLSMCLQSLKPEADQVYGCILGHYRMAPKRLPEAQQVRCYVFECLQLLP